MAGSVKANSVLSLVQVIVLAALVLGLSVRVPDHAIDTAPATGVPLAGILEQISADSILQTIKTLSHHQTRRSGSQGSAAAVAFVMSRLERLGIVAERQDVIAHDGANSPVVVTNVFANLDRGHTGKSSLFICAHYDSRAGDRGNLAPGADDNASGVAVLLETARVLARSGITPRVTLAFFGGEEDSLLGSGAFVDELLGEHLPLRGVINVDMVGYDEYGPQDIVVFTNPQSIPLALEVIEAAARATRLVADTTITTTGNSDHAPFWRAGQPAVSIWEGYDHNPYNDTSMDNAAMLTPDFLVEITRLIVAAAVHLGGAGQPDAKQ